MDFKRKRSFEGQPFEFSDEFFTQKKEKAPGLIHLRSSKLVPVKQGLQTKLNILLEEFGIPAKPKMATTAICAKYDQIRDKAAEILDLRKLLDKVDHDVKVLQVRKNSMDEDTSIGETKSESSSSVPVVCFLLSMYCICGTVIGNVGSRTIEKKAN